MVHSGNIAFLFCRKRAGLRDNLRKIGGMKQEISADPVPEIPQGTGPRKGLIPAFFPVNRKEVGIQSDRLRKRCAVVQNTFRGNFADLPGNDIQPVVKHLGISGNTVFLIIHDPSPGESS